VRAGFADSLQDPVACCCENDDDSLVSIKADNLWAERLLDSQDVLYSLELLFTVVTC
jgi:hypothetical protein